MNVGFPAPSSRVCCAGLTVITGSEDWKVFSAFGDDVESVRAEEQYDDTSRDRIMPRTTHFTSRWRRVYDRVVWSCIERLREDSSVLLLEVLVFHDRFVPVYGVASDYLFATASCHSRRDESGALLRDPVSVWCVAC